MSTARTLRRIVDEPSPEVRTALRRLTNALQRPPSTATDGDLWARPPRAAFDALDVLQSHYSDVRTRIAGTRADGSGAGKKRQLLAALDAEIEALKQFEMALYPDASLSDDQQSAFDAAKSSSARARTRLRAALKGL